MSWVPKAISRAGESGASAKSGPSPIYLSVSRSLCPARRSAPTAGRDRTNLASLTTYPASTRVPFLALRARAEGAGLRGTDACGGWAEVAPLEPAGETSARPPRRGVGGSAERRGHCRPLCATSGQRRRGWRGCRRWRVPQCFAASRCPEPAHSPLPGPGSRAQAAASWVGQQRRGPFGMSWGPSAPLRTHFSARSRRTRGSYWSFHPPL